MSFRSPFDQPQANPADPYTDYKNVIMASPKKDLKDVLDEIIEDVRKDNLTNAEARELKDMIRKRAPKLVPKELTVQELASMYVKYFETAKRGNQEEFIRLKEGAPSELKDLIRDAHEGMLPDDETYRFIHDAMLIIADIEDTDEPHEQIDSDVDVYNSDLLAWVSSNLARAEYVDDAVKDFGYPEEGGLFKALMMGQYKEREEVYYSVLKGLQKIIEGNVE